MRNPRVFFKKAAKFGERDAKMKVSRQVMHYRHGDKMEIGWKEWCALPDIHIPAVKAKIDTGAKTSSLHAYNIEPFYLHHQLWVKFDLHPIQRDNKFSVHRTAPVIDQRFVTSSTGHKELRYVIKTHIQLGLDEWEIELTLTNREKMMFRMLLGRDAIANHAVIDASHVHRQFRLTNRQAKKLFKEL